MAMQHMRKETEEDMVSTKGGGGVNILSLMDWICL